MKTIKITSQNKLVLSDIEGFLKRRVTIFGNSAKVSCPKEYLGRAVYLVVVKE
jgi:putative transposon-encoded protein